jgi:hypothetical protein
MQFNKSKFARLIHHLETKGYVVESQKPLDGGRHSYLVLAPGLDGIFPIPDTSPVAALQKLFWNHAELEMDTHSGSFQCRWVYWSWGALLLHSMISLLVLLSVSRGSPLSAHLMIMIGANLIPVALSAWELARLRRLISSVKV